jgi:sensor histidine kinase YesM
MCGRKSCIIILLGNLLFFISFGLLAAFWSAFTLPMCLLGASANLVCMGIVFFRKTEQNPSRSDSQQSEGGKPKTPFGMDAALREDYRTYLRKQMQYSALQSQINPHFLYNTLETIRSAALQGGMKEIALMIESLARYFRYSIGSGLDFVTLQEEMMNIKDYFFILQYRFGNKLSIDYEIEDEQILLYRIPKMSLQPLVENAVFHGVEQKPGKGEIRIRIRKTEKKIYMTVSDNGLGIPDERVKELNRMLTTPSNSLPKDASEKAGIALANVNERIRLYFGEDFGIWIDSIFGEGTDVSIVFPCLSEIDFKQLANEYE